MTSCALLAREGATVIEPVISFSFIDPMNIQQLIEAAFDQRSELTPDSHPDDLRQAVIQCFERIEAGTLRAAEPTADGWQVNEWVKKAILLSFRLFANSSIEAGYTRFYDKVGLKYADYTPERFAKEGVRVVPPATARRGTYIAQDVVLMPSYVNIGAYVGEGTMVDTWSTVGSCAQIGANVHLSGGVGIGGVLEPLQARPTIIEDNCFIGARSEVVEGVIVERDSVLSMGVYLSQSTRIYNRATQEVTYGRIPAGSVVVPGALPAKDGSHSLAAAIIVKTVDSATRAKVSINELLRS